MKIIIYIVIILIGLILFTGLTAYGIGSFLPQAHTASVVFEIARPVEKVWKRVADMPGAVAWRSGLKTVEKQKDLNGNPVWRETDARGDSVDYETVESKAPHKLIRRIATKGLPYGGAWTVALSSPRNGVTEVRITENGEVYNPIFRFVSRFIMGHDTTLRGYAKDLKTSFAP